MFYLEKGVIRIFMNSEKTLRVVLTIYLEDAIGQDKQNVSRVYYQITNSSCWLNLSIDEFNEQSIHLHHMCLLVSRCTDFVLQPLA